MKYLVIIAAVVVGCIAAPPNSNTPLERPSPINPIVHGDTKPQDELTPIKDNQEAHNKKPFYPTALPPNVHHHLGKPEHAPGHASQPQTLPAVVHKDNKKVQDEQDKTSTPEKTLQSQHTSPAVVNEGGKHKRDTAKQSEDATKVNGSEEKPQDVKDNKEEHKQLLTPHKDNVQVEDLTDVKPVTKQKPSAQKHHPHEFHPESPRIENKHTTSEEQKPITLADIQQKPKQPTNIAGADTSSAAVPEHPVIRTKPVPVAELFSRNHDNQ